MSAPAPSARWRVRVTTLAGGGRINGSNSSGSNLTLAANIAAASNVATAAPHSSQGGKPLIPALPLQRLLASESSTALAASSHDVSPAAAAPLGRSGFRDGSATEALFSSPSHAVLQSGGGGGAASALFISDRDNHAIRRIDLVSGDVTTVACRESMQPAAAQGAATSAAVSSSASVIAPAAVVASVLPPLLLPLNSPAGLLLDPLSAGSWLIVSDSGNHLLRKISLAPSIAAAAAAAAAGSQRHQLWAGGAEGLLGLDNAGDDELDPPVSAAGDSIVPSAAEFPTSVASASAVAVPASAPPAEQPLTSRRRMANRIREEAEGALQLGAAGAVGELCHPSTAAGARTAASAALPAAASVAAVPALPSLPSALNAKFSHPAGLCWDASSSVWVCDRGNGKLKRIGATGQLWHMVGKGGSGPSLIAPESACVDARGGIVFADSGAHCIRRLGPDGVLSLVAGVPRHPGFRDGSASSSSGHNGGGGDADGASSHAALFRAPFGLALDPLSGGIFVSDEENHAVRFISKDGRVVTLAGGGSSEVGVASAASLTSSATAVRPVVRPSSATPRSYAGRAPPALVTSSFSSSSSSALSTFSPPSDAEAEEGFLDGLGSPENPGARFFRPRGLAYDSASRTLYVCDAGNHAIRALTVEDAEGSDLRAGGASFGEMVPADPFPTARLMQNNQPASSSSSSATPRALLTARTPSSLNRHASLPSFAPPFSPPAAAVGSSSSLVAPRPSSSDSSLRSSQTSSSSVLVPSPLPADTRSWSRIDVSFWLLALSPAYETYVPAFHAARIDGIALMDGRLQLANPQAGNAAQQQQHQSTRRSLASESALAELGVSSKMHRRHLAREILRLQNPGAQPQATDASEEDEGGEGSEGGGGTPKGSAESSRAGSASAHRPLRPRTASGWRPSSASAHANAAADALLHHLHLDSGTADASSSPAAVPLSS